MSGEPKVQRYLPRADSLSKLPHDDTQSRGLILVPYEDYEVIETRAKELAAQLSHVLCVKHASYTTTGCLVCNGNKKNDALYRHNRRLKRQNRDLKKELSKLRKPGP